MKHKLLSYFLSIAPLSQEEQNAILESMVTRDFKKGDHIIREGRRNQDSFFLLQGFVRQYKIADGKEYTTGFFSEGDWIISLTAFETTGISEENLICMEDCSVIIGNEEKARKLFRAFPGFESISRAVLERILYEKQKWMTAYLSDTPENRYLKLLANQPDIFQKVPQYQIASYIGVKPESLSRIRKRIAEKS